MPRPGFEPESSPRKGEMMGRTTPTGHIWARRDFHDDKRHFEPWTTGSPRVV